MRCLFPLALALAAPAAAQTVQVAGTPVIAGTRLDVSATGIVRRAPDLATIGAGVVTQAGDAGRALSDNTERMTAVMTALKRASVAPRDIKTAQLGLQPQYRYADGQAPVLTGYQASNRVAVRLRDLGQAGRVIDALVAAGANEIDGPSFALDHPEAALDEARAEALTAARARAELYAKAAGLRVVRIIAISEAGMANASIQPMREVIVTGYRAKAASPVQAGEQELSVTLGVTFELG